ncbi:MAG: YetF domain-containing protein [Trueperaceae bacterium]
MTPPARTERTLFASAAIDWRQVLLPETPLLEIIVRGSLVYLALFVILRFGIRRQVGEMGITDLLVVVLIADAAQNAMGHDYGSVADGLILVLVIAFWAFAIDWLGFHVPAFATLARPKPKTLVFRGRTLPRNMARELITEDELDTMLREQGVEDIRDVREARMEPDGRLSVITEHRRPSRPPRRRIR